MKKENSIIKIQPSKKELFVIHAKTEYASSPKEYTNEELEIIEKNNFECEYCGNDVFQLQDFPVVHKGELYCDDCERDNLYTDCEICEESFLSPTVEDHHIVISKEVAEEAGADSGIYKVLQYPYVIYGFFGFEKLIKENIKRIGDAPEDEDCGADSICSCCVKKYVEDKITKQ